MKGLKIQIIIFAVMAGIYACASGGKRVDYDKFPVRADMYTFWGKCLDGDIYSVCKNECHKYDKKNKCKKLGIKKMNISHALNTGFIVVHKVNFFSLLGVE
jgi:hypothetical protein